MNEVSWLGLPSVFSSRLKLQSATINKQHRHARQAVSVLPTSLTVVLQYSSQVTAKPFLFRGLLMPIKLCSPGNIFPTDIFCNTILACLQYYAFSSCKTHEPRISTTSQFSPAYWSPSGLHFMTTVARAVAPRPIPAPPESASQPSHTVLAGGARQRRDPQNMKSMSGFMFNGAISVVIPLLRLQSHDK